MGRYACQGASAAELTRHPTKWSYHLKSSSEFSKSQCLEKRDLYIMTSPKTYHQVMRDIVAICQSLENEYCFITKYEGVYVNVMDSWRTFFWKCLTISKIFCFGDYRCKVHRSELGENFSCPLIIILKSKLLRGLWIYELKLRSKKDIWSWLFPSHSWVFFVVEKMRPRRLPEALFWYEVLKLFSIFKKWAIFTPKYNFWPSWRPPNFHIWKEEHPNQNDYWNRIADVI